jgi:thiol-disulfide isomerase/thioredoxin
MRSNRLAAIGRGVLAAVAISWAGAGLAADEPPTLTIGSPLPSFSLPGIDGKTYTDQSFKDAKFLVLIFTCPHCPTAQAYQERIKRLVTEYTPKGVKLVAINPNHPAAVRLDELGYTDLGDSFEEMQERARHQKFNFLWLDDGPKQELSQKMGPVATPHVFIFDASR